MNSSVNQTNQFSNGFLSDSVEIPLCAYSSFEKGGRKNVHATIPKGNTRYDHYTVPDTVAVEPTSVA